MKIFYSTLALGLLFLTHHAPAQTPTDKIDLHLRLQTGKSYSLHSVVDQQISQAIEGQKLDVAQTIGINYVFDVLHVDADGTATTKLTYKAVEFRSQGAEGVISYDSADAPAEVPLQAKGFAAIVGESLTVQISAQGQVLDMQGADALLGRALARLELPDGPIRTGVEDALRRQFNAGAIKTALENMLALFPGKPVGIGDSWSKQVTLSKGFPMLINTTWTLKSRKNGIALIEAHSTIDPNPAGEPLQLGQTKLIYAVSGTQQGTLEIEADSGWLSHAQLTQKAGGQIHLQGNPANPPEDSWPVTIKSMIRIDAEIPADTATAPAAQGK